MQSYLLCPSHFYLSPHIIYCLSACERRNVWAHLPITLPAGTPRAVLQTLDTGWDPCVWAWHLKPFMMSPSTHTSWFSLLPGPDAGRAALPRSTLSVMFLLAQGLFLFQRMPLVSWPPDHSLRSIINRNPSLSRQTNCIRLLCLPKYLISTLESMNYIANPEEQAQCLLLTTESQCLAQRLVHDRIFVNAS